MIIEPMQDTSTLPIGAVALTHLGVIRVEGDEAAKFIHGQLTHDFSLLGMDKARLCAFCSPKGRMLASFIGFKRSPTEILLVCNVDILPATLKRLSMFVMRAKAKLTDVSSEFAVWGLTGGETGTPWTATTQDGATVVDLYPACNTARKLWVAPHSVPQPEAAALTPSLWAYGEVMSGIAVISQPVVDAFVPQMLNYESVDGVSFKKGCYPGQEVVARSQFRGTLKRRAYIVGSAVDMQAGQEIFTAEDDSQPVGTVVQSAANPSGGYVAIVSMQIAAATNPLHLGSHTGSPLNLLPLPYGLLEDI